MKRSVGSFVYANYRAFILVLVLLGVAVAFPILSRQGKAQIQSENPGDETIGPIVGEPLGFAITPEVRDLPPALPDSEAYRKFAGLVPEMPKWNKDMINPIIPGFGANAPEFTANPFEDPLLKKNDPRAPQAMPTPSLTFEGVNGLDRQTVFGNLVMPPDTNGDVGPNHYISIVNGPVGIYNKNTGALAAPLFRLSSLFAGLPTASGCPTRDDGDPVVLYDSLADRWMLSQFSIPTGSTSTGPWFECIAISQTADPTGAWYAYAYQTPTASGFPDYPKLGIWRDAIYMTDHQNGFLAPPGAAGSGTGFFAFDRNKMLIGDPNASFIYFNRPTAGEGGIIPSDIDGITPPPANAPMLFFRYIADEFGAGFIDGVRPYQFIPDFATPANSTLTVLADIPTSAFDARQPSGRADVEQPAPATAAQNLDSLNDRAMFRVAYSNVGTTAAPDNRYLVTWGVNVSGAPAGTLTSTTFTAGVRWAEIARSGAGTLTLRDEGTHAPGDVNGATGINRWMQHGAFDNNGNIAIGYSASSTTVFPSVRWAGRTGAAPAGTLNEGEAEMFTGTGVQQQTNSRWGDYSSMSIDPTDGCTYYYHQEYRAAANNANAFVWNTRVGRFKYPSCTNVPKGTLNVTVTNCQTSAPVQNAIVNATGGYAQNTNASGVASFSAAPGSYTVTGTKNLFTVGTTNATVTNGNTTNVAFCIQGSPQMATGGNPTLTAESCLPANNAPDPGETVTVTLPVLNTGAANTTNLVGTLQATGGVVSPGPAQTYGVVTAGGAAVSRPFTFTVSPAALCGSTVTLTVALQDGALNLGTVVYTIRTGVRPGSGTSTVSYTGPPVAVPDANAAGVDIPLAVSGVSGNVTDLNFRFDAGSGACDATLGNTNAAMDHTFIGDLTFKLTAPNGTTSSTFMARRGGTRENICLTTLDDDGGFPNISTIATTSGTALSGSFAPETTGPLSAFDGVNPNGTWTLNVSDNAGIDTGFMRRFSLIISSEGQSFCCGGPSPSPTPTPSTTPTPTATPTNTPTATPTPTPPPGACTFSNGGLNPQATSKSGVAAPAGFFWSEVQNTAGNLTESNTSAGFTVTQGTFRLADNFTITQTCTIQTVAFYAYLTGGAASPSPFTGTTLQIWNGRPGDAGAAVVFGDTTTNRLASSVDSTYFRIFNTVAPAPGTAPGTTRKIWKNTVTVNTVLAPGTYWLDWASTVSTAAAHFAPSKTIEGVRGAAGDNARQQTVSTGVWADVIDAGNPATAPDFPQDFPFDVVGTGGGSTPTPTPTPTSTPTGTPTATPTPAPGGVFSFTGSVAIPDNNPTGVNITLPVVCTGPITDVDFRFDGVQSATVNDPNVGVAHSWVGDLIFKLTAPNGSNVTFYDRPGVPASSTVGCNNNNLAQILINDDGAFPTVESQCNAAGTAAAFPTGTFLPNNPMSGLDGGPATGTWTLNVSDNAAADTGTVRAFSIILNNGNCGGGATPTPTATPTATPTNTPTATPTATPTNTMQFSAASFVNDESTVGDTPQNTVVTVTRTGLTTGASSVSVNTGTGTANVAAACGAGVDIAFTGPVVLNFAAGETSKTFNVPNCPDTLYEADETRQLVLSAPTGGGVGPQGTATLIVNDTANQYRNTTPIDSFQGSVANPYPSTIVVAGAPASVHRIRVTLYDFYHAFPDNIDVLLVNPQGRKMVIMGDAGGPLPISSTGHVTLTFTDNAGQVLPDSTAPARGKYEPTTWETIVGDFPLPAPNGPYAAPGSAVGGTLAQTLFGNYGLLDGNGTWSLYIRDDNGAASPMAINGQVQGGWGLELLPATAAGVEVSGRVMTPDGRGLRNAVVSMVDSQGVVRTATTSSFGYYTFGDVEVGASYVVSVQSRRYRFAPRVVQVFDTLTDVDFTGLE